MTAANYSHQAGIFNPLYARPVYMFGAGSVGSWLALFLAKMGLPDITVWDDDTVASHNVPMSLYGPRDVGRHKVDILQERVADLTGTSLNVQCKKYEGDSSLKNVTVISCVDTMAARQAIWQRVKNNPVIDLFCDTRVAAAYVEVLSIDPNDMTDISRYDKLLFTDKEAVRQTCGRHGVVFSAVRAADIVAANLALFWSKGRKEWRIAERCDTLERIL